LVGKANKQEEERQHKIIQRKKSLPLWPGITSFTPTKRFVAMVHMNTSSFPMTSLCWVMWRMRALPNDDLLEII